MAKKWCVDDVLVSKLAMFLNQVAAHEGTVFAVVHSARADHMIVVWYTAASTR